jgi:DNA-binding protein HU-beta
MATSAKKPAAKAETVTLRTWRWRWRRATTFPKKQAIALLEGMVGTITKHLKKGARIRMSGLGILQVRKRPARMGRNPATGEAIKIKASKKIAFRAAKDLKEAI